MTDIAATDPSAPVLARLTVLAGPTAVGKGTVVTELRRRHPDLFVSVSATTRQPRPGEIDGVHYHFVSDGDFDSLVASGQMLEWALVHGAYRYGTPRGPVQDRLNAGFPALLEIDLDGARQVRQAMPGSSDAVPRTPRSGSGAWSQRAQSWTRPASSTTSSSTTPWRAPPQSWRDSWDWAVRITWL